MKGGRREGFVLLCVIWVLALLTVITLAFARRAMIENRLSAYALDRSQATYMARGAAQRALVELRNKAFIDRLQDKEGRTSFDQRWANPPDLLRNEDYFTLGDPSETESEECFYIIEDAERYISVNRTDRLVLDEIPGMSFRTVTELVNMRNDAQEDKRAQALMAEEEMLGLRGIDEEAWEGDEETAGIKDLVTVWGDGLINLNTCSLDVMLCIPQMDEAVAERIYAWRAGPDGESLTEDDRPILDYSEMASQLELNAEDIERIRRFCKLDSSFFTITAIATQRQGRVRARVTAAVQLLGDRTEVLAWREEAVGAYE